MGNAQAWYYHTDKTLVLWECFFDERFRNHPLAIAVGVPGDRHPYRDRLGQDTNMQNLWKSFEHYLLRQFPQAATLATPFNDPIAESIEEYQSFLQSLGYSPLAKAVFGKRL